MKKLLVAAALFVTMNTFANPTEPLTKNTVNEKVLTAFKETFSSATNPVWHGTKTIILSGSTRMK
ncbi:MAG: hypothetical protein ABR502_10935 [Chitinophagaceae bacterium]